MHAAALATAVATALVGVVGCAAEVAERPEASASADAGPVDSARPTRVVLTPASTPTTAQSVSWLAAEGTGTSGRVEFRVSGEEEVTAIEAEDLGAIEVSPGHHFSATMTGLEPATSYDYRVGEPGGWSTWQQFSTADPTATSFQFIYYGDAQVGLDSTWPAVVEQAQSRAPQSIGSVHAGDLVDAGGDDGQWTSWFAGMAEAAATTNVLAVPGNHDYMGDTALTAWKAAFENPRNHPSAADFPQSASGEAEVDLQLSAYLEHWETLAEETVYFTDYQDVRFVALNANQEESLLTPGDLPPCANAACPSERAGELWIRFQADWLDRVLESSPSKWNVVTFHQPVYSASADRDEPILRAQWVPVLEEHNVDLVMMGHDHVYARGHHNDDRTEDEGVTDGPVYIVANSGAKHYELASPEDDVWARNDATQMRRESGVTTYQVIDVSADRLVYRSYLVDKTSTSTSDLPVGALFDEFTVSKTDDGVKRVTEGS